MISFAGIGFLSPWALLGLLALPAIWWLLRLTPPTPQVVAFPAIRILRTLRQTVETSDRSPPWLLFLRLITAALIIMAVAHPVYNLSRVLDDSGRLVLVIDNGWAAVDRWGQRQAMAVAVLDEADRLDRGVMVIATAEPANEGRAGLSIMAARDAREFVQSLEPQPWPTDRSGALDPLLNDALLQPEDDLLWITDGLGDKADEVLMGELAGQAKVMVAGGQVDAASGLVLRPPEALADRLRIDVERALPGPQQDYFIRALAEDGQILAREALVMPEGSQTASLDLVMPPELRNRLGRLVIEGSRSVAAQVLTDERWRRRPVGLVGADIGGGGSPLLRELFYLNRALEPITDLRVGSVDELMDRPLAVVVLADPGRLTKPDREMLDQWVAEGGLLVRFAGPKLARFAPEEVREALLPVDIKSGDRVLGGALSWRKPARLGEFPEGGPFHGLSVGPDVTVTRQVLARPNPDLVAKTWAVLDDGTPLVTGSRLGDGWSVLVHTTANTEWSNLALSGTFVEMLARLVTFSQGVDAAGDGPPLKPLEILDAYGRLTGDVGGAKAIPSAQFETQAVAADHPPGFYGRGGFRQALNLSKVLESPLAMSLPMEAAKLSLSAERSRDFRPLLFVAAFFFCLIDFLISLRMRGILRAQVTAGAIMLPVLLVGAPAKAQTALNTQGLPGNEPRLAFVITGDGAQDELSEAGLKGLSAVTRRRTAAELARPQGIDPNTDELVFYPLIYWPIGSEPLDLTEEGLNRVRRYLTNGGVILFDTLNPGGGLAGAGSLRRLAVRLDLPPLIPVTTDHVLSRSFYLLQEFPGRWTGSPLWVEPVGERKNDGVSPVIAGSHDWASAWAVDEAQRPLYPVVPGGERQREMAFRFGINLIMYSLTGNYKGDQVHMLEIIKRLGE